MLSLSLLSSVLLASASFALPASKAVARDGSEPLCKGAGVIDVAHGFSLAAYNVNSPNANSTGAPLVFGQAGSPHGAEYRLLSTWASYPYNDMPTMNLDNGVLLPADPHGSNVAALEVTPGWMPEWVLSKESLPAPAQIYCGFANTDPNGGSTGFPILAVNGDADSFSLCAYSTQPNAQVNVVYKPVAGSSAYVFDTCYPVKLQMIGLN